MKQLELLIRAGRLIEEAIELLDQAEAPGDIAARIDHGNQRLQEIITSLGVHAREDAPRVV